MGSPKNTRKKGSKKPKAIASSACEDKQTGFTDDIAHAQSWDIAVDFLCQSMNLPGMEPYFL